MNEYVDELDSVPTPEHVEQVMDGLFDTITGTESLTSSQHYLNGVLVANGLVRRVDIEGNEGFLSKVGDGVKAAIEYIKKMFNSIWNFFFKKEKKEITTKTTESLNKASKKLDEAKKTKVTPENADAALKKAEAGVNQMKDGPDKTKLKKKVEDAKENKDDKQKAYVATMIPGEIFEGWRLNEYIVMAYEAKFKSGIKKLEDLRDKQKEAGDKHGIVPHMQKVIDGAKGVPEAYEKIKDLDSAYSYIFKAKQCQETMNQGLTGIESKEAEFKELIADIESGKDKENAGKSTVALKESLAGITGIVGLGQDTFRYIGDIARMIDRACVLVI